MYLVSYTTAVGSYASADKTGFKSWDRFSSPFPAGKEQILLLLIVQNLFTVSLKYIMWKVLCAIEIGLQILLYLTVEGKLCVFLETRRRLSDRYVFLLDGLIIICKMTKRGIGTGNIFFFKIKVRSFFLYCTFQVIVIWSFAQSIICDQ